MTAGALYRLRSFLRVRNTGSRSRDLSLPMCVYFVRRNVSEALLSLSCYRSFYVAASRLPMPVSLVRAILLAIQRPSLRRRTRETIHPSSSLRLSSLPSRLSRKARNLKTQAIVDIATRLTHAIILFHAPHLRSRLQHHSYHILSPTGNRLSTCV